MSVCTLSISYYRKGAGFLSSYSEKSKDSHGKWLIGGYQPHLIFEEENFEMHQENFNRIPEQLSTQ